MMAAWISLLILTSTTNLTFDEITDELPGEPQIGWIKVLSCVEGETGNHGGELSILDNIYDLATTAYTFKIVPSGYEPTTSHPLYSEFAVVSYPNRSPILGLNNWWDPSCQYDFNTQPVKVLNGTDLNDFYGTPVAKARAYNPTFINGVEMGNCHAGADAHPTFGTYGGADGIFYKADALIASREGIWVSLTWGGTCYWQASEFLGQNISMYFGFLTNQTIPTTSSTGNGNTDKLIINAPDNITDWSYECGTIEPTCRDTVINCPINADCHIICDEAFACQDTVIIWGDGNNTLTCSVPSSCNNANSPPTNAPTVQPSDDPTSLPTSVPSYDHSNEPSHLPTNEPIYTTAATLVPSELFQSPTNNDSTNNNDASSVPYIVTGGIIGALCIIICTLFMIYKISKKGNDQEKSMMDMTDVNRTDAINTKAKTSHEINEWLSHLQLPQYSNNFAENGFDKLQFVKTIKSERQLEEIGIKLRGHRLVLMDEINKMRENKQDDKVSEHSKEGKVAYNHKGNESNDSELMYNEATNKVDGLELPPMIDEDSEMAMYDEKNRQMTKKDGDGNVHIEPTSTTQPDEFMINSDTTCSNQNFDGENEEMHKNNEILEWLKNDCGYPQYFELFIENGFDSLDVIQEITNNSDLAALGINMMGHRIKIMAEIKKLKQRKK